MPVQYTSITDEHQSVRNAAGIFDISHMGEFLIGGAGAEEFLNQLLTNDIRKLSPGQGQYTLMCNLNGGVIDDLYVYCLGRGNYMGIVNASRIEADFDWMTAQLEKFARRESVRVENKSDSYGAVAVQGPAVPGFIDQIFRLEEGAAPLASMKKNEVRMTPFNGELVYVARTGYTGEEGFEIVAPAPLITGVWDACMEHGKPFGIKPAGLGARDTLRTEVCYPLYGHELDEQTTPIEAGVGFFVALDKPDFNGRQILADQKTSGAAKKLVAFKMKGKSPPPRPEYAILTAAGSTPPIGRVTSGTQSPSLGLGIGLGFVPPEHGKIGGEVMIEIRGNKFPAEIVGKPIYKKKQ